MSRMVKSKPRQSIAREWDAIAEIRDHHIESGLDISFNRVLLPSILALLGQPPFGAILDCGCGTGQITARLGQIAKHVTGIDVSAQSLAIARNKVPRSSNIDFELIAAEDVGRHYPREFSAILANMTLMDIMDLPSALHSLAQSVQSRGVFVFSITHPCYWPRYAGYEREPWFSYHVETIIESPFRISLDSSTHVTTHVHRPIETYVNGLHDAGFVVEQLVEPLPSPDVTRAYPSPWEYPRFLIVRCVRT